MNNANYELISAFNNMADLKQDLDQLSDAMYFYDKALQYCIRPDFDNERFTILSNQASLYSEIGQLKRAIRILDEVIDYYEKKGDTSSFSFANKLGNRAVYFIELGFSKLASIDIERALNILEANSFKGQMLRSNLLTSKSNLLEDEGDVQGALKALKEAMSIIEVQKGKDHPRYLTKMNNLGLLLIRNGEAHEAEIMLEQSRSAAAKVNSVGRTLRHTHSANHPVPPANESAA